jgi:hypothetical protein
MGASQLTVDSIARERDKIPGALVGAGVDRAGSAWKRRAERGACEPDAVTARVFKSGLARTFAPVAIAIPSAVLYRQRAKE